VRGVLRAVRDRLDVDALALEPSPGTLALNEIGTVEVRLAAAVPLDPYATHRRTGAFLLVDQADGTTLAAGMVGPSPLPALAARAERCRTA